MKMLKINLNFLWIIVFEYPREGEKKHVFGVDLVFILIPHYRAAEMKCRFKF